MAWFNSHIVITFVVSRNKLQFSGWYKGKGREKLPKPFSLMLNLGFNFANHFAIYFRFGIKLKGAKVE